MLHTFIVVQYFQRHDWISFLSAWFWSCSSLKTEFIFEVDNNCNNREVVKLKNSVIHVIHLSNVINIQPVDLTRDVRL